MLPYSPSEDERFLTDGLEGGSCPPPRSKSRRSTMFAFRRNRNLVESRSPEISMNDIENLNENIQKGGLSPNSSVGKIASPVPPDANKSPINQYSSDRKPKFTPSPPQSLPISLRVSGSPNTGKESNIVSTKLLPLALETNENKQGPKQMPKVLSPISSVTSEFKRSRPDRSTESVQSISSMINGSESDVIKGKDHLIMKLKKKITKMKEQQQSLVQLNLLAKEEADSFRFLASIQEQKITELESQLSLSKIEKNEALSHRNRKHKSALSKANKEKDEYESRANEVIKQLNEQMAALQTVAMERIETLETELMQTRRENERLLSEVFSLRLELDNELYRRQEREDDEGQGQGVRDSGVAVVEANEPVDLIPMQNTSMQVVDEEEAVVCVAEEETEESDSHEI